jgi:hypothetical protein
MSLCDLGLSTLQATSYAGGPIDGNCPEKLVAVYWAGRRGDTSAWVVFATAWVAETGSKAPIL